MYDTNLMTHDELEEELIGLAACIPSIVRNPASLSDARIRAARVLGMTYSELSDHDGQYCQIVPECRLRPTVWTEEDFGK